MLEECKLVKLRIDTQEQPPQQHLFANLPFDPKFYTQDDAESAVLLREEKRKPQDSFQSRVYNFAITASAVVCLLFLIAAFVVLGIATHRVGNAVASVDRAVSLHSTASSMLKNVDHMLNSSAAVMETAHQLGLKTFDAAIFSQPHLAQMLNSSNNILQDMHRIAEHPSITVG
jgi:hypothetical protein